MPPSFSPQLFTNQAITDINAFAPRAYNTENRTHATSAPGKTDKAIKDNWYKRVENNGWRPISDRLLLEDDEIVKKSSSKPVAWHHSKLVRQVDLLKKRKRKKLQWMKKM